MLPTKIIDENLRKQYEDNLDRPHSGKYYPSSFGRCFRLQLLSRLNIPKSNPPDDRGLRKMEQGVKTHMLNQRHLPRDICEIEIKTEHISGRCDILLEDRVSDIKSTDEFQVKKYWNKPLEILLQDKKPDWLQVGWYGVQLKKPYVSIFPCAYGTFLSKEIVIPIEAIETAVNQEVIDLIRYWKQYNVSKRLPLARPRAFGGNDCNYCSWRDYCIGVEEDGHREHPFKQSKPNSKSK